MTGPLCLLLVLCAGRVLEAYILDDIDNLRDTNSLLFQQLMMQQGALEDRQSTDGQSGIIKVRKRAQGSRPYYSSAFTDAHSFMGMHNHPNHINTVGLEEIQMGMNGVVFTTRHNDYVPCKPHSTSTESRAIESIEYPEVPDSVKNAGSVDDQMAEMAMYFKAFKEQNADIRDYKPYFKPVLCYLEGMWTITHDEAVLDLGKSDRHQFDAKTWAELHKKARFNLYSGRNDDNHASLPYKVFDTEKGTNITTAQWNYRILCHPMSSYDDLPANMLRPVDDFFVRMAGDQTKQEHVQSPRSRFRVCPSRDGDCDVEGEYDYTLLDELMYQIPGPSNYGSVIQNDIFGNLQLAKDGSPINAARYHRQYKMDFPNGMGEYERRRGFADPYLFMAMTSSSEVAGMKVPHKCTENDKRDITCEASYFQRWTYAIPLEVIYLTPLQKWNPYNIEYHGDADTDAGAAVVTENGRDGSSPEKAFSGSNSKNFYRTPATFFEGGEVHAHPDDTVHGSVHVLDSNGNDQQVFGSGIRVFLPSISNVGVVRQRYPIAPVFEEGSAAWKEVLAMTELATNIVNMSPYFLQKQPVVGTVSLQLGTAFPDAASGTEMHTHEINLTEEQTQIASQGNYVVVESEDSNAGTTHKHTVSLKFDIVEGSYVYSSCDGNADCAHKHNGNRLHFLQK